MSAQTTIDDRTAEIIRSAMMAAQAGRNGEACAIVERGLADGGDETALNALLGALLCGAGSYSAAIDPLRKAAAKRPADPVVRRNLVTALIGAELFSEALDLLPDEVVDSDPTMSLLRQRAYASHMADKLEMAIADYRRFLTANDGDWESWNNLGNAYLNTDDLASAVEALRKAASINPRAAPTRLNLARALRDLGDFAAAESELRAMARDFPADEKPLVDLYAILQQLGRPESEAENVLEAATLRDPGNIELLLELGDQQIRCRDFTKAEATYRRVLSKEPANGAAYFGLARVLEHHRPEDLGALAHDAEAANIGDESRLNLIRAFAARRTKSYAEGLAAIDRVPADIESPIRWHLAGQLLEASGRYDEAFAAFSAMNSVLAQDESEPQRRATEARKVLQNQLETTTASWRSSWGAVVASDRPSPVFLAGFPRSGTTLLDTILMGHPDVAVMEEQSLLRQLDLEFGGFDALPDLDEGQIRKAQDRYFEMAAERVEMSPGTLVVDKSPLYLQRVPQILRLFPDARFIFALRHPLDVVFSCFKANFRLNNSMSNFLELRTAADFYDLTFRMWERALDVFSPEVHTVRYESMIEDPESVLRPVVQGLGLKWQEQMLDHQKTAKERGVITTASYAQVTEPLYRHADGRWRHYREHLKPVIPVLEPWIRKFGYEL